MLSLQAVKAYTIHCQQTTISDRHLPCSIYWHVQINLAAHNSKVPSYTPAVLVAISTKTYQTQTF